MKTSGHFFDLFNLEANKKVHLERIFVVITKKFFKIPSPIQNCNKNTHVFTNIEYFAL